MLNHQGAFPSSAIILEHTAEEIASVKVKYLKIIPFGQAAQSRETSVKKNKAYMISYTLPR